MVENITCLVRVVEEPAKEEAMSILVPLGKFAAEAALIPIFGDDVGLDNIFGDDRFSSDFDTSSFDTGNVDASSFDTSSSPSLDSGVGEDTFRNGGADTTDDIFGDNGFSSDLDTSSFDTSSFDTSSSPVTSFFSSAETDSTGSSALDSGVVEDFFRNGGADTTDDIIGDDGSSSGIESSPSLDSGVVEDFFRNGGAGTIDSTGSSALSSRLVRGILRSGSAGIPFTGSGACKVPGCSCPGFDLGVYGSTDICQNRDCRHHIYDHKLI